MMKSAASATVAGMLSVLSAIASQADETNAAPAKNVTAQSTLTMGGMVITPERKASPFFTGKSLSRPPKQKSPWSPPASTLPTNYVTATALLFEQGLADPRGCEYREIEVGTGDVWGGDGGVVNTHGWVLPDQEGQPFAICWNGLVYPAVSVGTNADLEADVMTLVTNGFSSWRSVLPEALTVQPVSLQGIHGCLLLRLGKVDLAEVCWLAQERRSIKTRDEMLRRFSETNALTSLNDVKLPDADPYLNWASDWAWFLFDRMICAHERRDEKLALADARLLSTAQPLIEDACAKRGFQRQRYWDSRRNKELQPHLNFLEQLPQLLADLERRDKEGPRLSVITIGLTNITDQTWRVAALVRDLDLVCAHQWSQPGKVNLPEDPIVSALITEGDGAVEPLLDCLEHDRRLTRSVGFGRDFHRGRTVIAVSSAADVVLKSILQAGFFNAAEMHAYWNKYKDLKIEDRWYAILNDDNARSRWAEAAANIVQPINITRYPGGFSTEKPVPTNAPVPVRGECLRAKNNPSVTELLTRHALESPVDNNIGGYDLGACCQMAEYLARWDVQAALPVAKTLSKRASTVMKYSGQTLGNHLIQLSLARARAGDPTAFDEYAEWIVTTAPAQFTDSRLECLEPMRQFPTNSSLRSAAEKLFGQTNSAWGSLPRNNSFGRAIVDAKLIPMRGYRMLLCRELLKADICGSITLERPGYVGYALTNLNQRGSFGVTLPVGSAATNGATTTIRWGDWIALALANVKTFEPLDPFASIVERDKTIQSIVSRLQQADHLLPREDHPLTPNPAHGGRSWD